MDVMDKLHEECGVFGIFRQAGDVYKRQPWD